MILLSTACCCGGGGGFTPAQGCPSLFELPNAGTDRQINISAGTPYNWKGKLIFSNPPQEQVVSDYIPPAFHNIGNEMMYGFRQPSAIGVATDTRVGLYCWSPPPVAPNSGPDDLFDPLHPDGVNHWPLLIVQYQYDHSNDPSLPQLQYSFGTAGITTVAFLGPRFFALEDGGNIPTGTYSFLASHDDLNGLVPNGGYQSEEWDSYDVASGNLVWQIVTLPQVEIIPV